MAGSRSKRSGDEIRAIAFVFVEIKRVGKWRGVQVRAAINLKAGRRRQNRAANRNRVSTGCGDRVEVECVHMREGAPLASIRTNDGGIYRRSAGIQHAEGGAGRR